MAAGAPAGMYRKPRPVKKSCVQCGCKKQHGDFLLAMQALALVGAAICGVTFFVAFFIPTVAHLSDRWSVWLKLNM